jgi:hypothetical protein
LGVVVGAPLFNSDRVRLGFSLTNDTYWAPSLQSQLNSTTPAGENQRVLYSTRDTFLETVPAAAIAYAASSSLRIGFSMGGDIVVYETNDSITNQRTSESSQSVFSRGGQVSASAINLLFVAGAQYDVSDHWKLSMVLKSPTLPITGSSKITIENTASALGTTTNTALYDPDASFRYTRSLQASAGVAYVSHPFEIEADLRYHSPISPYSAFSSSQSITTTSNSGGAPTTTSAGFNDVQNQFKSVVNVAVGSRYRLSEETSLHGGFFSSRSPLVNGDSAIFRGVDLYGVTLGASLEIGHFSGSLGAAYEFGKSDPYTIPSSPSSMTGESLTTTVKVTALSLLYAISFSF